MAPSQISREVLIWTIPAVAVLVTLYWYRRKKTPAQIDTGGTEKKRRQLELDSENLSCITNVNTDKVIAAIKKAQRELENSCAIKEVADFEESVVKSKSDSMVKAREESTLKIEAEGNSIKESAKSTFDKLANGYLNESSSSLEEGELVDTTLEDGEIVDTTLEEDTINTDCRGNKNIFTCNKPWKKIADTDLEKENLETPNIEASSRQEIFENPTIETSIPQVETVYKKVLSDTSNEVQKSPRVNRTNNLKKQRLNKKIFKDNKPEAKEEVKGKSKRAVVNAENTMHQKSSKLKKNQNMEVNCGENVDRNGYKSSSGSLDEAETGLEQKLARLKMDQSRNNEGVERDSANHSPAEVMLGSPSMSHFSDAHSEGSSDSGKGCSDIPDISTPPPQTPAGGSSVAGDVTASVYEFIIPQVLVGRLIGRHGAFLSEIRGKTHTAIFIKKHPDTIKLKICAIEGAPHDIETALAMIRQKFPLRRYPELSLDKVTFVQLLPSTPCPLSGTPDHYQLQLIEGVNNDVILSSLITAGHMFFQQPTHPTYHSLSQLNYCMNHLYNTAEAPVLDTPVKEAICAAPAMGGWYRAMIVDIDEERSTADIRFLDYGGFLTLQTSALRKIRGDLLPLPFQAIECILANVVPVGGEDAEWSDNARLFVQSVTCGHMLQAYICSYTEYGVPLIYLYAMHNGMVITVNNELINLGYAEPLAVPQPSSQQQTLTIPADVEE